MNDNDRIEQAMILAAGLGTRMRPITATIPKPLVEVHGKALLDHALDALENGGVKNAAVNVHYLADQIERHVENRLIPEIKISDERRALLDSGGGVKRAIRDFKSGPFFILNADSFWLDNDQSTIKAMADVWDSEEMDMMLLLSNKQQAVGFDGAGDFHMDESQKLTRRGEAVTAPYIYAGAIIAKAEAFHAIQEEMFSLNQLFDEAIANERLFGFALDGLWLHVGTPQSISEAEQAIDRYLAQNSP